MYAILDNHLDILLEVPEAMSVSDDELVRRLRFLCSADQVSQIAGWLQGYRELGEDEAYEALKLRHTRRIYDLSEYVKTLKQKYTQWHNKRRGRKGTLWEERFKSIMIQPDRARKGERTERRSGFSHEEVQTVLESDGKLTLQQALHCRVRYFTDGVVLGSKAFVEDIFQRNREQFGLKRRNGARLLRKAEAGGLCTMRDLRMEVINLPGMSKECPEQTLPRGIQSR